MFSITVNGVQREVDVDPAKPLLWVLREQLGLLGVKFGCGVGLCGACTVLLGDEVARSCVMPISSVGTREVRTIEGLDDERGRALKDAWVEQRISQCGYCQPGQIVSAYALLGRSTEPTSEQIQGSMTNLCRCGTYQRIRAGIASAAARLREGE